MNINKKVKLNLVGLNGNAFSILAAFGKQADKENWTKKEIEYVHTEAMKGDYNNLLDTIMRYTE